MSEEQLTAFLEAVNADAGLLEKLKAAGDVDAFVAIAKAAGFAISATDLQRAKLQVSDQELENVNAGLMTFLSNCPGCNVVVTVALGCY